jgi:hypothetical protein
LEEDKKQENNERDILYNTTKQISDKIQQQERSIDIENNNKDEYGFTSRKNGIVQAFYMILQLFPVI